MAAIELYKADGNTAGIFYCSECRIVHPNREQAEWCHGERVCACGKKVTQGHYRRQCDECYTADWKEKERQKEAGRFEAATKIPESDYAGSHIFHNDHYYESVEEAIDGYIEGQEPEYVWACKAKRLPLIDLGDVTCNLLDNMWEDAEIDDLYGVEELDAALKAFNEANAKLEMYEPDYSTAILVK